MSDLDKAIRDAVAFGGLPLTGRFEAAFAAVLDLHAPESHGMRTVCEHCIDSDEDPIDYPCATVRAVARELRVPGVSGEDRSEPTPAPGDTVRLHLADGTVITGRLYLDPEDDDRERVEDEHGCGWLVEVNGRRRKVEVVSPEGTP